MRVSPVFPHRELETGWGWFTRQPEIEKYSATNEWPMLRAWQIASTRAGLARMIDGNVAQCGIQAWILVGAGGRAKRNIRPEAGSRSVRRNALRVERNRLINCAALSAIAFGGSADPLSFVLEGYR